jgi:membrane protein CcdC involved in cytochrome C biogenesis
MVDEDREVFVYLSQEWCEQLSLSNIGTVLRNSNIIGHHACSREIKTKNEMFDAVFVSTGSPFYLVPEQDSFSLEGLHMLGHLVTATMFRDMIKWTLVLYSLASCL